MTRTFKTQSPSGTLINPRDQFRNLVANQLKKTFEDSLRKETFRSNLLRAPGVQQRPRESMMAARESEDGWSRRLSARSSTHLCGYGDSSLLLDRVTPQGSRPLWRRRAAVGQRPFNKRVAISVACWNWLRNVIEMIEGEFRRNNVWQLVLNVGDFCLLNYDAVWIDLFYIDLSQNFVCEKMCANFFAKWIKKLVCALKEIFLWRPSTFSLKCFEVLIQYPVIYNFL